MSAHHPPPELIVRACALLLTPNHEFREWLKEAALTQNIFPASIDRVVNDEVLYNHSVAFITPIFHGQEELNDFINRYYDVIFNSLLLAWPFSMEAWKQGTARHNLGELFDVAYYFYLVNLLDSSLEAVSEQSYSVTTLRPKLACLEWIHKAGIDEIDDLELDLLRKFGVAFLTPSFKSNEEESHFIQEKCKLIWEAGLACYCEDHSLWPRERTYEKLLEWFDCVTCYPVIDLTKVRLVKKVA
jgi:hypothetical protein